jgi:hypothetical protein
MDVEVSESSVALRRLHRQIVAERAPVARPQGNDPAGTAIDQVLWTARSAADIRRVQVRLEAGGLGPGTSEGCVVLEALGGFIALVAHLASILIPAVPLAVCRGDDVQRGIVAADALGRARCPGQH